MKRFAALSLAALMLLTVFASAASAADVIEIRGPVWNGSNIDTIIDTYGDGTTLTVDATQFAAFYYDIDDDVTTETLSIVDKADTTGNVIGEGGIVYKTTIQPVKYTYENAAAGWSNYSLLGFFADKYIPLNPDKADKLAKLVLDSDDKYTIRTGELLDLGEGYSIEAKQVDVDGAKVWLELTKDGEFVDDEIISVTSANAVDNTWEVELDDIQGEDNVIVLRVHVNQVFQGAVDSIAQIEGVWLIDYANAMTIESDDEFDNLDDVSINGDTLTITNADTFTLNRDDSDLIAKGMYFKTADTSSNQLRFYVMKEITEPGTYEIRGQVASGTDDFTWNATNFAGFYYDLNDDVATETLKVSNVNGNVIGENGLEYATTIENVDYEYSAPSEGWDQYPVIGFFAEEYIPLNADKADKLAKLILDSDDKYTIRTGELLDLGEGYSIEAKQVDVDGKKVWLELTKDGEFVDDEIISVDTGTNTWEVELDDIQGEDNVVVLRVHVNQVFQGAVDSIAQIEGLWLIDYANAMTIESDDEFGELNNVNINGDTLSITNDNTFTLTRDSDEEIGEGMYFKIADTASSALRYYPYVEKTIGDEGVVVTETPTGTETPSDDNMTEATTPAEGVTPAEGEVTATEGTNDTGETTTEEAPADTPGFGVVLGLVGLLAVVYLVRRNN
ncbi:MAG: S-layer protein domain-containing protein [Methanosarcina sp.]|uniref:S-layer protein domain-containing protein n=1 Tax=Methanosarcina sp. TaxID=2213 RepID=UPI0026094AA4|nr:S-layer protein domain-containing protein [Methanosarcina sp.]MDD3247004.1 S-layer protein domain-containing protein [Methanosarcina sp.]MDD4247988.1 S-layer protein domain-containing protein [Methanosarcina sp.]